MLSYKNRLEDTNWKMNVEVFIMNNKLQAKDLINLGLFTVLYFVIGCCVAIPIGLSRSFFLFSKPVVADYRYPFHAVPHKG